MPATTPIKGLPYPIGGDPIDTAGDIQRLALALDAAPTGGTPLDAYPVGSIYLSAVATDPGTIFGGTWAAFGTGRMLIGVDPADATMATPELTGGAKTHVITIAEMPSHVHADAVHVHAMAHTHTIAHTHTLAHDHASATFTSAISAAHAHASAAYNLPPGLGNQNLGRADPGSATTFPTDSEAGHTHTTAVNLASITATTSASSAASTGGVSTTNTAANSQVNTGAAGSGGAMSLLNPFIAVHMWKRTA